MDLTHPHDLLSMPDSENPEERLTAIRILGEMGDAEALTALRARLKIVSTKDQALIVAVGKLKRRLKVK